MKKNSRDSPLNNNEDAAENTSEEPRKNLTREPRVDKGDKKRRLASPNSVIYQFKTKPKRPM